ncbi:MAG: bifunctional 2-polyprenyl-6-hydroxyphenol methylase/3-demethylubiquinol 3-O-methyltransferase UbiG [Rhodospirillaceae bacterium]|jgi:2-polyprenyl-6-hydroxyphenyl methylase / 3-demethylubiquinone-9 3-methyltransferase|nr:bifunctional 2-polyprenyl-6-hydroxyphenol methylase/3-demethylubiquinol 3-O-methyltransferase UbiG [Rhodospirillaceae bacterium]MBT5194908.1 bifunctional 2-polyprenyl-6-hydroxyphenol methylase/3-demethylubiquinol 3-O-methyltransferase UbiG [Rhodospirillaceae bacterium]MBT5895551.1 bifunctional 2-polyprenyl-6-hydroxyphenol methylase/3-demethylubiquinol 3-O-methyltransferase UbiG [Rhodospirillaceae bacterium]MBT6429482.1 bifunctional 2-polyprenyl-6-hydroxyphenol methylase/3-demethylubiquinol 3-
MKLTQAASIDSEEIDRFAKMAAQWWDVDGAMAPLHRLNPARLQYSRDRLRSHFDLDTPDLEPLNGLRLLDVGCGGGLLSEPFARMGASVTAIDAGSEMISAAMAHARAQGLEIDYRTMAAEDLAATGAQYDAVVAMEVIEHVADIAGFIGALVALTRPGGALLLATMNRTPKSFLQAILGAEYVLRWVPIGTHDWRRFRKPAELGRHLRQNGAELRDVTGMRYLPRQGEWQLTRDAGVNYLAYAARPL